MEDSWLGRLITFADSVNEERVGASDEELPEDCEEEALVDEAADPTSDDAKDTCNCVADLRAVFINDVVCWEGYRHVHDHMDQRC